MVNYHRKLPWYFYNTGQKYHGILTLEKGGTTVNYCSIFITLAPAHLTMNSASAYFPAAAEIEVKLQFTLTRGCTIKHFKAVIVAIS